jgi:hypothetical protein
MVVHSRFQYISLSTQWQLLAPDRPCAQHVQSTRRMSLTVNRPSNKGLSLQLRAVIGTGAVFQAFYSHAPSHRQVPGSGFLIVYFDDEGSSSKYTIRNPDPGTCLCEGASVTARPRPSPTHPHPSPTHTHCVWIVKSANQPPASPAAQQDYRL